MAGPFVFKNIIIGGPSYDPEAVALFNRMTTQPDSGRKKLISDFFEGIKSDLNISSLSSAFDCLWFFAAHAQQAAQLNWVKNSHNITEVNTPTWTLNRGYAGNGSTMYLNTNYAPGTNAVAYALNSAAFGTYNRSSEVTDGGAEMGASQTYFSDLFSRFTDGIAYCRINNNATNLTKTSANSQGLISAVRTGSNSLALFRNGISQQTGTLPSTGMTVQNFYILAKNNTGSPEYFSARQIAFAFIGSGSVNQTYLFTRVEQFLDAIGAGVIN